jgi:hypothetical protein
MNRVVEQAGWDRELRRVDVERMDDGAALSTRWTIETLAEHWAAGADDVAVKGYAASVGTCRPGGGKCGDEERKRCKQSDHGDFPMEADRTAMWRGGGRAFITFP